MCADTHSVCPVIIWFISRHRKLTWLKRAIQFSPISFVVVVWTWQTIGQTVRQSPAQTTIYINLIINKIRIDEFTNGAAYVYIHLPTYTCMHACMHNNAYVYVSPRDDQTIRATKAHTIPYKFVICIFHYYGTFNVVRVYVVGVVAKAHSASNL